MHKGCDKCKRCPTGGRLVMSLGYQAAGTCVAGDAARKFTASQESGQGGAADLQLLSAVRKATYQPVFLIGCDASKLSFCCYQARCTRKKTIKEQSTRDKEVVKPKTGARSVQRDLEGMGIISKARSDSRLSKQARCNEVGKFYGVVAGFLVSCRRRQVGRGSCSRAGCCCCCCC